MNRGRSALKAFFQTGDRPTQSNYEDLIDSMYNTTDEGDVGVRLLANVQLNLNTGSEQEIELPSGTFVVSDIVLHNPVGTPNLASELWFYPQTDQTGARICNSFNNIELLSLLDSSTRQLSFSVLDHSENIDTVTGSIYAILNTPNGGAFTVQCKVYGYKVA